MFRFMLYIRSPTHRPGCAILQPRRHCPALIWQQRLALLFSVADRCFCFAKQNVGSYPGSFAGNYWRGRPENSGADSDLGCQDLSAASGSWMLAMRMPCLSCRL